MKKTKTNLKSKLIFKHIFIPHEKNGWRPHAFRHRMLTLYMFVLLSAQLVFGVAYFSGTSLAAETLPAMKQSIITLTNNERQKNNTPALTENQLLDQAAAAKLNDMIADNYWDHISPSGTEAWDFITETNYRYYYAGENLAKGFIESKSVVNAWMRSPSHKKNILNPNYQDIGVAVGEGKIDNRPTILIVQLFASLSPNKVAAANSVQENNKAEQKLTLSLVNLAIKERLPYFVLWLVLFLLLIFDGAMLRKAGLHRSKKQMFQFRSALLVNVLVLILLGLNYVSIS